MAPAASTAIPEQEPTPPERGGRLSPDELPVPLPAIVVIRPAVSTRRTFPPEMNPWLDGKKESHTYRLP